MFWKKNKENPYLGMRQRALEVSAAALGLQVAPDEAYGILMETGHPKATVTLLSLGEGSTSLYFSNGGGIIGGGEHPSVRTAALSFVADANHSVSRMELTRQYPLPEIGQVRFYALTPSGIRTYQAREDDLGNKQNAFWPLFHRGQDVITELRLMEEARKNG